MLKIPIPTDFSEISQKTIKNALTLFDASKVELMLFHAVEPLKSSTGAVKDITEHLKTAAQEFLNNECEKIATYTNAKITTILKTGYLTSILESVIHMYNANLLLMSSKGESNLYAKVFGTNAEQCLRNSSIPVLVIPTDMDIDMTAPIAISTDDGNLYQKEVLEKIFTAMNLKNTAILKLHIEKPKDAYLSYKEEMLMDKKVQLQILEHSNVTEALNTYLTENKTSILVTENKHHSKMDFLFNSSITKKLMAKLNAPILSLPS